MTIVLFLTKDFLGIKFEPINGRKVINHVEMPRTTSEQYEDLLLGQLRDFKSGKSPGMRGKPCERLIVFVDDLDRLSADEMVSGLDAIRTFMEIPRSQLPDGLGIVFVISCDEEKIAHALASGRQRARGSELPAAVSTRSDARRYLDRIFQFRLEIPHFPRRDMRQFILGKLQALEPLASDLVRKGVDLEALIDRMIHVDVESPRNALQILNSFLQGWWIASERELDGIGNDLPGGLHEGAVTQHAIAFGSLCALKVDFSEFFGDLQEEPDLITRFTNVVIRANPIDDQPESTRELLEKYLEPAEQGDQQRAVRKEFRSLRQFIASLQGMRWPPSLQPLLLLTEDPITRKYGARTPRLFSAFVSGDQDGVLEVLGRNHDTKPLKTDDVQMLRHIAEELTHETENRKVNASTVLAGLANRLPIEQARIVVAPLARQLGQSGELRWRVGIDKIAEVLNLAEADDQVDVVSHLIQDILSIGTAIDFRLESGEPPNLEEAVGLAKKSCSLALRVWSACGLPPRVEEQLLNWLEARRVLLPSGADHELPISDLEKWVSEHEKIVHSLGPRYTNLVVSHLESEDKVGIDAEKAMPRCLQIFNVLSDSGEDSRQELWGQLTRLVGVRSIDGVTLAQDIMKARQSAAPKAAMSEFMAAFAKRLKKDMDDPEEWKLDWESGADVVINLLGARLYDLDLEAIDALADLTIAWSEITDTADFATKAALIIKECHEKAYTRIIESWIPRLTNNLPATCIRHLANRFGEGLSEVQRVAINNQLQAVIEPQQVSDAAGAAYCEFMGKLPVSAMQTSEMQTHMRSLFNRVSERYQNPGRYLERIFPIVPKIVPFAPSDSSGQMLNNLFTRAKGHPPIYGWLHHHMILHWPAATPQLTAYTPAQLFDEASSFVTSSPNAPNSPSIIKSMQDMIEREIVDATKLSDFAKAAVAVWPIHPSSMAAVVKSIKSNITAAQVADFPDELDLSDDVSRSTLEDVWKSVIESRDNRGVAEITTKMLQKSAVKTETNPDLGMHLWIKGIGPRGAGILEVVVTDNELNDAQRCRTWAQIEGRIQTFNRDFFLKVLPHLLQLRDAETTIAAILACMDQINSIFVTIDQKFKLADTLLRTFPLVATNTSKTGIAKWIRALDATSILRRVRSVEAMTKADLELLQKQFPKIKSVNKALRSKIARSATE